jgi:hypothetical protein
MKGRKIEHEHDGDTRGMTRREQVVISRLRTGYTRATHIPRINGITDRQCLFCDTGNMDKRSRRNEKDHRISEKKIGFYNRI